MVRRGVQVVQTMGLPKCEVHAAQSVGITVWRAVQVVQTIGMLTCEVDFTVQHLLTREVEQTVQSVSTTVQGELQVVHQPTGLWTDLL